MSPQRKSKPKPDVNTEPSITIAAGNVMQAAIGVAQGMLTYGTSPNPNPNPGYSTGTSGNAALDQAFIDALNNPAAAKAPPASKYDALQDVYGLGVVSSTPVRFRSTQRLSQQEIVSGMGDPGVRTGNVGGQLQRLYAMPAAEVSQWQRKLFEGGFYPKSTKATDIIPGVVDDLTAGAWYGAVITAARFNQSGRDTTVEDVIDMSAQALDYQGPASGGGSYQPTRLTDPASLKAMADQISTQLLGRKLTDEEKAGLINKIHGAEAGFYGAVRGQAGTITDVDPQAEIQQSIQQDFKPEYDATNIANTYDIFKQIIGGSSR